MKKTILLTVSSAFFCLTSLAHDLWIVVDNYHPAVGEKVIAKIMFGHKFPETDILIPKKHLNEFFYITPDGQKKEIIKTWEEKTGERNGFLAGEIIIEQEGTYIIYASRKVTGQNCKQPSEKHGKSLVTTKKSSDSTIPPVEKTKGNNIIGNTMNNTMNNKIEIVPLSNFSEIKVGDTLSVKILYEGNPLSTYIYGTYTGYCSEQEPFSVTAQSDKNGIAHLKISNSFVWFITVNFKRDFSASLTFEIK